MRPFKFLVQEPINVNIALPIWFILFALAVPMIAYIDFIVVGGVSIKHYLTATMFEVVMIMVGFTIAKNTGRK